MKTDPKQKVVIHAGLPKTGSTFLQDFVFPAIDPSECDYNPPEMTKILIELSKEGMSQKHFSEERIETIRMRIDAELKQVKAPTLFLSVEGLMPIHCGGYQAAASTLTVLARCFPDAELVVFLREQANWIRSAYSFCLVSKYVLPFDDFVNRDAHGFFRNRQHDGLNVSVYEYDFHQIKRLADEHFGRTHFFRFEDLFEGRENEVLARITRILEVSPMKLTTKQSSNKGLDEELMVLISTLISKIPFRDPWKTDYLYVGYSGIAGMKKARYLYLRHIGKWVMVVAKALYPFLPKSGKRLFSLEEIETIRNHYRDANAMFWESIEAR